MNSCVRWTGALNSSGYPITWKNGKTVYAHREAVSAPKGSVVLHSCDNKWCVNPQHLSIGTHKDNSLDMVKKNRQAKGESCARSKLLENEVLEIRSLKGKHSSRYVANLFNTSKTNVLDIWKNKTWRHLEQI